MWSAPFVEGAKSGCERVRLMVQRWYEEDGLRIFEDLRIFDVSLGLASCPNYFFKVCPMTGSGTSTRASADLPFLQVALHSVA